jgi:hypothetical protein
MNQKQPRLLHQVYHGLDALVWTITEVRKSPAERNYDSIWEGKRRKGRQKKKVADRLPSVSKKLAVVTKLGEKFH